MTHILLALVLAYLLGSVSGSLVLGRFLGVDIRASGSGNAGGTNAFRTRGWRFALAVVLIDIGKGALAAWLGLQLWTEGFGLTRLDLAAACTLLAAVGHTWPLSIGPVFLVWLCCLVLTGYVGLSTILAAAVLVPLAIWLAPAQLVFALAAAGFILFTHRRNVMRLWNGSEHRFERVRLLRRRGGQG